MVLKAVEREKPRESAKVGIRARAAKRTNS
jgi:hypothetical protein